MFPSKVLYSQNELQVGLLHESLLTSFDENRILQLHFRCVYQIMKQLATFLFLF